MKFLLTSCNYNAWPNVEASVVASLDAKAAYESSGSGTVDIVYKDNGSVDESREFLESCAHRGMDVIIGANIGKARAINDIVKSREGKYDVIVSLDSDMKFEDPRSFFFNLEKTFHKFGNKISCAVGWQTGNSMFRRKFEWIQTPSGISYFAPKEGYGYGIAGGCIAVSAEDWKTCEGYDESRGIYGSNDGIIMLKLFRRTNRPICVVRELVTYHPPEKDEAYKKWKDDRQKEQMNYGKCMSSVGFYDDKHSKESADNADVQGQEF